MTSLEREAKPTGSEKLFQASTPFSEYVNTTLSIQCNMIIAGAEVRYSMQCLSHTEIMRKG